MRTLRIAALTATLALVLVLPLTVHAGGWSTISLDSPGSEYVTGQEFTVGFTVLQHGQTPLGGLTPTIKLHHPATGQRQMISAVESGPIGHYVAKVILPRPGAWEWEIQAFEGDHPLPPLKAVESSLADPTVQGAAANPAPTTPPLGLAVEQPFGLPWPALLALALAAGAVGALVYTRRLARRPA